MVQGRAQTVVLVTGDSKHQEAASLPTSKAHGQASSHSPRTTPETPSATAVVCHLCATRSLQGAAGILLDELLVAGVADALGVDAGREGQLMH